MLKLNFDDFKRLETITKKRDKVDEFKHYCYVDTISTVIRSRYQYASCTIDAFSQNVFYIEDLVEVGLITDDNADGLTTLNIELFHKENKKRGDKDGRH